MLPSVHTRCALSGKFLHMSLSLFDQQDNENNENKYLVHFLWRLNEPIDKKCLKQTTAQSKLLINVSFHNRDEGDDNENGDGANGDNKDGKSWALTHQLAGNLE